MKKENGVTKQVGKKLNFWQKLWKYRVLTLMCVPAMIFFFAFNYMPLPGIYVAFVKYNYRDGIFGSKFVGLQNFEFLWESDLFLFRPLPASHSSFPTTRYTAKASLLQ